MNAIDPLGLIDTAVGVSGEFSALIGYTAGVGFVIDWNSPLDTGYYLNFGPATGVTAGLGLVDIAIVNEIEGKSTEYDVNVEPVPKWDDSKN